MCLAGVMAARWSPKPLVGVRVSGGMPKFCRYNSVVECLLAKQNVVGSNPTTCSTILQGQFSGKTLSFQVRVASSILAPCSMNVIMYKVLSKVGLPLNSFPTLNEAMIFAKTVGMFVTIKGPDFEVCGVFGVDSVKNRKTPDGVEYSWVKRRKPQLLQLQWQSASLVRMRSPVRFWLSAPQRVDREAEGSGLLNRSSQ